MARTFPLARNCSIVRTMRSSSSHLSSQVWYWIKSSVSVPMLRKLFSTYSKTYSGGYDSSSVKLRLDGHWRFLGGTFVATYSFFGEFARSALPSHCSLWPSPYAQAVSKKLHPRSMARCNDASDSASREPVQPAMPHMPYPISLTCQFVRPNRLNFIACL